MTVRKLIRANQRAYAVREHQRALDRAARKARATGRVWPGYWITDFLNLFFIYV